MKTFEEAKALLKSYISCNDGPPTLSGGCSLCCSSHGGGKARYQDCTEEVIESSN